jgi:fatty acid desaturase
VVPAYALDMRAAAKPAAAPVPADPEQQALVLRKYRRFVIVFSAWYAALIAAGVVLMVVLDLWWPLLFVVVVGSFAPVPLMKIYAARMRAALKEE